MTVPADPASYLRELLCERARLTSEVERLTVQLADALASCCRLRDENRTLRGSMDALGVVRK